MTNYDVTIKFQWESVFQAKELEKRVKKALKQKYRPAKDITVMVEQKINESNSLNEAK